MGLMGRLIMMAMPITPRFVIRWVAKRYVAGSDLEGALSVMRDLSGQGASFTIDVLGEEITTLEEADFFVNEYARVLDAIVAEGFDANISLKPTAFGLLIDKESAVANHSKGSRKRYLRSSGYGRSSRDPIDDRPRHHNARNRPL